MAGASAAAPGTITRDLVTRAERQLSRRRFEEAWQSCEAALAAKDGLWWRVSAAAGRVQLEWGMASDGNDRINHAASLLGQARTRAAAAADAPSAEEMAELANDHGVALYELGELRDARDAFEQTLLLKPAHERALCNLGLIHWSEGRERIALHCFGNAIATGGDGQQTSVRFRRTH